MLIKQPKSMIVSNRYKITEPCYDEGLEPETDIIEVIKKTNTGLVLRNIEHNFTYERSFEHLLTCEICNI